MAEEQSVQGETAGDGFFCLAPLCVGGVFVAAEEVTVEEELVGGHFGVEEVADVETAICAFGHESLDVFDLTVAGFEDGLEGLGQRTSSLE